MGERGRTVVRAVCIFPGQGAQKVGMGRDLAERFPICRELFHAVDDALGMSLSRLMWEGPDSELTLTHNAQPAILAHSMAVHALLAPGLSPVAAAGHSLGEYSAYAAAKCLEVTDAARLVRRRGELMLEAGRARRGAMAAVVGLATDDVQRICSEATGAQGVVVPANLNAPDQTVISGDPAAVEQAGALCRQAGAKRVMPLNVSGAFHSPLMEPALPGLRSVLDTVPFSDPVFPVIANAAADAVRDGARARTLLVEQLTSPVRWVECMREGRRLADPGEVTFVEFGPGRVLSGLLKRIDADLEAVNFETVKDVEAFMERVA